jgi:hypothetical protein
MTENLTSHYDSQKADLNEAMNMTNNILDILEATATVASSVHESALIDSTALGWWWPFIIFPPASLVMGSYGLPPSVLRNFGLLALGEAIAVVVSSNHGISLNPLKGFQTYFDSHFHLSHSRAATMLETEEDIAATVSDI